MAQEAVELLVLADAAAWRVWLDENEDTSDGVWLLCAKKGAAAPTTIMVADALLEALCSGWIDGQRRSHDGQTFIQRFTPRRPRSLWSARNVELVAALIAEGRMRPRGQAEIDRAKADGRWERAYAGQRTATVPADLAAALAAEPAARAAFEELSRQNRYAVLHPLMTAPNEAVRRRRLAKLIDSLAAGRTP